MRNEGVVLNRIGLIRLSVKLEVQTTSVRKGLLAADSAGHVVPEPFQGFYTA
jgi:hypothetical protein